LSDARHIFAREDEPINAVGSKPISLYGMSIWSRDFGKQRSFAVYEAQYIAKRIG
jgi:hypothetical protein